MRKILLGSALIIALLLLAYAYQAWGNNKSVKAPDQAQIQSSLAKAIQWLDQNRDEILAANNPVLWHMIQRAAEITDDQRLTDLFATYSQRNLGPSSNRVWRPLFYPGTWVPVSLEDIRHLPQYNWHFIYASLCEKDLRNVPEISAQDAPSFCDQHPISPACVTHQLMGIRLLQRSECGDSDQLNDTVQQLQQRIYRQLQLDPRVVDVYMQRVLMLVESGAGNRVKPVWIQNLIDAQQADGGWSNFEPLVALTGGRYFGFSSRLFSVTKPASSFHMTAQGVLLFALLNRQQDALPS